MDVIHIESCPVCSGTNLKPSFKCEDFLVSHQMFTLYNCKDCNFTFTQDFPSQSVIGKYYDAPEYISHTDTNKGFINKLYHFARTRAIKSKTNLVKKYSFQNEVNTLLDIGCGTGYFLHAIEEEGWKVDGIDASDSACIVAKEKFNFSIQKPEYISSLENQSRSAITLWHVLEHIENMNDIMDQLHRVLEKDGTLFIALPNKLSCDAVYYKDKWAAYDVPRHLWHFSPRDFEKFALKHKFKLVEMKTMYFDPFYISILSEKYRKSFSPFLFGILKGSFFLFESLINKSKSSSIVYILKKID